MSRIINNKLRYYSEQFELHRHGAEKFVQLDRQQHRITLLKNLRDQKPIIFHLDPRRHLLRENLINNF